MAVTPAHAPRQASLSVLTAACLTFLAVVLGFALLHAAGALWSALAGISFQAGFARATGQVALTTLAQAISMGSVIVLALRLSADPGGERDALGVAAVGPGPVCLLFVAGLCLQLPLSELANLLHAPELLGPRPLHEQEALAKLLAPSGTLARATVMLCIAVIVPTVEELLFRGVLQTGLVATQGRLAAIVVSAGLFGLCHVRPVPVLYAFVAGLILGWLRTAMGSVLASVALHAGVNALPVMLAHDTFPMRGFNVPSMDAAHLPPALSLGALGIASCLVWLAVRGQGRARV